MRQGNSSRRSRGRGNGKRQPRSGHMDSHGPEVRVRGTPQQVCTKYIALARDASSAGDRIAAENLFQHAEHYFRVMGSVQENIEQQNDSNDGSKSRQGKYNNEKPALTPEKPAEQEMDPDDFNAATNSDDSDVETDGTNKQNLETEETASG